jgi:hypothetical protein
MGVTVGFRREDPELFKNEVPDRTEHGSEYFGNEVVDPHETAQSEQDRVVHEQAAERRRIEPQRFGKSRAAFPAEGPRAVHPKTEGRGEEEGNGVGGIPPWCLVIEECRMAGKEIIDAEIYDRIPDADHGECQELASGLSFFGCLKEPFDNAIENTVEDASYSGNGICGDSVFHGRVILRIIVPL